MPVQEQKDILRFALLANAQRLPGAVLCSLGSGALPLLEGAPVFGTINAFVSGSKVSSEAVAALEKCGVFALSEDRLILAPSEFPGAVVTTSQWVVGEWYLQMPPKPSPQQLASRSAALRLAQLVASDAETREVESVLRHDPALSYQLLRLVNSPGIGVGREVSSLTQALMILGRQHLRRWINLLLFSSRKDDPRGAMLLAHAALRARRMELLERDSGGDRTAQDRAFMVGMFSMLGVLLGQSLAEVLKSLQLGDELNAALATYDGALGALLKACVWLEVDDGSPCPVLLPVTPDQLLAIDLDALAWVHELVNQAWSAT